MNVSQLHERVRLELLRRMERGALTASLLARKTGLRPPHISNFIRSRRRLSTPALDRVLAALGLSVEELLVVPSKPSTNSAFGVPLVEQELAMHQGFVSAAAVKEYVHLPEAFRADIGKAPALRGIQSDRFVAVTVTAEQALSMTPVLRANGIAVLDRHAGVPTGPRAQARSIYAVRLRGQMHFAYVSYEQSVLVLRPHAPDSPVQLLPIEPQTRPAEFLIGRVCAIVGPA